MKVRLFDRIAEIEPAVWDGTGTDPLSAHAVLAALEGAGMEGIAMRYAILEGEDGRTLACAPFARIPIDAARLTHGLFRDGIAMIRRLRPSFLRTSLAICGTPLSVGNPPVRIAAGVEPRPVVTECAGLLCEIADQWNAPWRAFKEIPEEDRLAAHALAGAGWTIAPSEPNARVDIRWGSFEGYLASLRHPYRRKIRLSASKLERARVRVQVSALCDGWDGPLHSLYESVFERAEVRLERLTPAFFAALGRGLGERARLIRFVRDRRTVAWVALLIDGDRVIDLFHGIDYEENETADLYFNQLAETIRFAISSGARRLSLGQSTETAKARFGATGVPLRIALRHRSGILSGALRRGSRPLFPEKRIARPRVFHVPSAAAPGWRGR